jgi:hypothetical protein
MRLLVETTAIKESSGNANYQHQSATTLTEEAYPNSAGTVIDSTDEDRVPDDQECVWAVINKEQQLWQAASNMEELLQTEDKQARVTRKQRQKMKKKRLMAEEAAQEATSELLGYSEVLSQGQHKTAVADSSKHVAQREHRKEPVEMPAGLQTPKKSNIKKGKGKAASQCTPSQIDDESSMQDPIKHGLDEAANLGATFASHQSVAYQVEEEGRCSTREALQRLRLERKWGTRLPATVGQSVCSESRESNASKSASNNAGFHGSLREGTSSSVEDIIIKWHLPSDASASSLSAYDGSDELLSDTSTSVSDRQTTPLFSVAHPPPPHPPPPPPQFVPPPGLDLPRGGLPRKVESSLAAMKYLGAAGISEDVEEYLAWGEFLDSVTAGISEEIIESPSLEVVEDVAVMGPRYIDIKELGPKASDEQDVHDSLPEKPVPQFCPYCGDRCVRHASVCHACGTSLPSRMWA